MAGADTVAAVRPIVSANAVVIAKALKIAVIGVPLNAFCFDEKNLVQRMPVGCAGAHIASPHTLNPLKTHSEIFDRLSRFHDKSHEPTPEKITDNAKSTNPFCDFSDDQTSDKLDKER